MLALFSEEDKFKVTEASSYYEAGCVDYQSTFLRKEF